MTSSLSNLFSRRWLLELSRFIKKNRMMRRFLCFRFFERQHEQSLINTIFYFYSLNQYFNSNHTLMRIVPNIHKLASLTLKLNNKIIQVAEKSYYDILGVSKTARPKQIRIQFLKKARQLHPDHNPSPEAQQKFKLLKQAYQVLKDPQKRYIYDSGISSEGINQGVYSGGDWRDSGKKYYQNKWYDFKKSNYPDQRDEYYDEKFVQDEDAYQKKIYYRILGFIIFIGGFLTYLYLYNKKSVHDIQNQHIKNMLEGTQQDKKTRRLRRYIQQRAKVNRVQQ